MAIEDLDIEENDLLSCLDEYFAATEKEPDEFDSLEIAERYNITTRGAYQKMTELERLGLFTSRKVKAPGWDRARRCWRKVQDSE